MEIARMQYLTARDGVFATNWEQLMHPTDSLRGDFGIPVEFDKVGEEEGLKRGCTGWLM